MTEEPTATGPPADDVPPVTGRAPPGAPDPESFKSAFSTYEVRENDGEIVYLGDPLANEREILRATYDRFREAGYDVSFDRRTGEYALVAEPRDENGRGFSWLNAVLFLATVGTTLYSGALWYYVFTRHDVGANPLGLLDALPFVVGVLGVLGIHELGHYAMSRYHGVEASLPYFIPMLPPFGTWGAVIRMQGHFPDRKSLFDVGVAGPLAGLVAAVVVTAVGLTLPPITVPESIRQSTDMLTIHFSYPPLFRAVAWAMGERLSYGPTKAVNPMVMGGWIGMFVTVLNLLPVGQLDGGHMMRAMLGPKHERLAKLVPLAPFAVAAYVYLVTNATDSVGIWVLWGLIATVMVRVGPVTPVAEDALDRKRVALGAVTFVLGVLCFTPVPISISA
ncbi:MAG: site-2 protease family protein [Halobacteriaceae archaeon]